MGISSILLFFVLFPICTIHSRISAQQSSYNQSENSYDFQSSSINGMNQCCASEPDSLNICPQRLQQYTISYSATFTMFEWYIKKFLNMFDENLLIYVLIISIIFSPSQHANSGKDLITQASVQSNIITSGLTNYTPYMGTKNNSIPYDVILQLNSVMAIICTEQGNRCRRLGDLRTAKRYYQMAIRAHECNRQLFIHVDSL